MKYVPKTITKQVNVTPQHPLVDFAYLVSVVIIISALLFFSLGLTADWLVTRLSPETENKIGQLLTQSLTAPTTVLKDDPRIQYLEELLAALPTPNETIRLPLTVHLLENETINAAILQGGHILVNTGLLKAVESENELAFVLAHELGHFQARDPIKGLGRSLVFISVLAVLGIGTSESGGLPDLISFTGQWTSLHYSRQQESAADFYALQHLVHRYGHGAHGLNFFKRIESQEKSIQKILKISQYFSTHPLTADRINELNQKAIEHGWLMQGEATPLPQNLLK